MMQWGSARATWYRPPNGAGPDDNGGACGFKNVNQYPFMAMASCRYTRTERGADHATRYVRWSIILLLDGSRAVCLHACFF
jgi:hypothetical protein